jgi:dTDP-4-dehydrorhamnose reductase
VTKDTLLVLGASGLAGYKTMLLSESRFETFGTYNLRIPYDNSLIKLDISKHDDLRKLLMEIRPDIVVNTVALHNVDYCETHEEEAFNINSKAVAALTDLCNNLGSRLIHISTDFVFDGNTGNYSEYDPPNPQSVYAKSKLQGELEAKRASSHSILRTSVIYGWTPLESEITKSSSGKPINFALWALSKMKKGEILKIVDDQFTSPTLADVLAAVIMRLGSTEKNDVYHVSGTSCISRYEFTKKVANVMGYSDNLVQPVTSRYLVQAAKRPTNSCLNCKKLQKDLNFDLMKLDQSLAIMRSQIEVESPSLLGN